MTSPDLHNALSIVNRLSLEEQQVLLQALQKRLMEVDRAADWALEEERLAFMLQHQDEIEAAYETGDLGALDEIEASEEYRALFGDMPWDEAYDRFEETWWREDD